MGGLQTMAVWIGSCYEERWEMEAASTPVAQLWSKRCHLSYDGRSVAREAIPLGYAIVSITYVCSMFN